MNSIEKLNCIYCDRKFKHRQNLTRHLRTIHKELPKRNFNLKCPALACEEIFASRSRLRDHIQLKHDEKLIKEEINFLSFEEFDFWKFKIEKEMKCCYVLKQTPKRRASGAVMYYYSCFRSGPHVSESAKKRHIKCRGSKKMEGCCPSSMDVIKMKDQVFVTFWKTHFGHDVEIGNLFFSTDEIVYNKDFAMSKHHDKGNIKCMECNINYGNLRMLREHLAAQHNLNYVEKEICFPNMIAFKKWKLDIERKDCTFFFAAHGVQKGSKCNRCLYRCHRTGNYEANDSEDKHKMNNIEDSKKIGITCTASMTVCEYAHEVRVKYCLQHYGHEQGTTYVQLSTEEQAAIDENVSNGIPLQEQLNDIKHAQSLAELFQARLIKKRDIHFFYSAYASEIYNAGMNASEYVEQWVRACSEMEDSPILLYRHEDIGTKTENLMLIIMTEFQKHILMTSTKEVVCLDSYRCVKNNCFTALVVIDEQDVAFPVAFCISSKVNKSSMLEFLSSVKESTGPLSCLYLMSNNDKFYYEAWQEVMLDESKWIWNIWSFESKVRKHLIRLVKDVPTREAIYRLLRTLMECNNQNVFVTMFKNFLNSLSDNALCNDFGKFFELQYGSNQELWACCYRKDLKFGTNFYLEYLHKTLLHFVRRSSSKQLDKFLMVLMKYLRFKMINRLCNMLDEEKIDLAKKTISMCHNMGLDIECQNINSLSDKIWLIRSENEIDAYVTQEYVSCPELCDLRCPDCDVCVHMYSCTCVHSMINANMCKHIHAVVWKFLTPLFSPSASPVPNSCDNIGDFPSDDPVTPDKGPDLLKSVLKRLRGVYKQVRMNKCQLNKNSFSEVLKLLDRCYEICSNCDISFAFESKSTQTETVPAVLPIHTLNSFIKVVPTSNSENIAPIPALQSHFASKVKANITLNSSKIHEKPISSSVPGFFAVQNIVLGSGGNLNPTSILVVPSNLSCNSVWNTSTLLSVTSSNPVPNDLPNSESSSSERQKQVAAVVPSAASNPILKIDNAMSSEKQKTIVTSSVSTPSAAANDLSTSERPQKRALEHVLPGPVQNSFSKSQHAAKKHCMKRINFPDVSSCVATNSSMIMKTTLASSGDSSTTSINTVSNSLSQVPSVIYPTASYVAVLKNNSDHSQMSLNVKPTTLLISASNNSSDLAKNSSDKISCVKKTSNKMPSSYNALNPSSPENESDAPCIIASTYSLKGVSDVDNDMDSDGSVAEFSPPSINELKSQVLLDSVSKKSNVVKTTVLSSDDLSDKSTNTTASLNSQASSVSKSTSVLGSFPFIPKLEPSSEVKLSVLPSSSSLSPTHIKNSVPHIPVMAKASKPSASSSTACTNTPIVITYPDSSKHESFIKSNLQTTINKKETTAEIAAYPKVRYRNNKRTCSVCETPGPALFKIPSNENKYKKWLSVLKWNVPPEQIKFTLNNARVCDRHFSESCFTSTLRKKLLIFAYPNLHLPSASSDALSALPSTASQCTSVEVRDTDPECSKKFTSPATLSSDINGHLQV
ncbi:unnamed protein product [Larinioides sclopetarius]